MKIAIIGMGRSASAFFMAACALGSGKRIAEHIWSCNSMGGVIESDRIFVMDDLRELVKIGAAEPNIPGMLDWLKTTDREVVTSTAYAEFPTSIAYPLQAVLNNLPGAEAYLNTTIAYMLALALLEAEEGDEIGLFGCDMGYADTHVAESGRGCIEWLIGIAMERGIKITIPQESTLMDANCRQLYGYASQPKIVSDPITGQVTVWGPITGQTSGGKL